MTAWRDRLRRALVTAHLQSPRQGFVVAVGETWQDVRAFVADHVAVPRPGQHHLFSAHSFSHEAAVAYAGSAVVHAGLHGEGGSAARTGG